MRKRCVVVFSVLAIVGMVVVSVAYAKPRSTIGAVEAKVWTQRGKIIEIKRLKKPAVLTIAILKGDEIIMYEVQKKKGETLKPLRKYDMKKIKALKKTATDAHKYFMTDPQFQSKPPVVRAITLGTSEDGKLEYRVHVYSAMGPYRGYWPLNIETWKFGRTRVDTTELTDPLTEKWGEPPGEPEEPAAEEAPAADE